jgi:hypothetical protein
LSYQYYLKDLRQQGFFLHGHVGFITNIHLQKEQIAKLREAPDEMTLSREQVFWSMQLP